MAKKETKKSDQNELIENPEVLAEKIVPGEDFLKSNSKILAGVLAVAVVLIGGILFFQYNTQQQNEKAQAEMFQAVYFFEQDSVDFALNGDGINKGFLNIIESYPRTDAANLALSGAVFHWAKLLCPCCLARSKAFCASSLICKNDLTDWKNTLYIISNYKNHK